MELRGPAGRQQAVATTLGAGGLFVPSEAPPPRGTPLELRLRLTEGGPLFVLAGRVAWRRRPGDPGRHAPGMGIAFTDREQIARLAEALDAL